MTLSLTDAILSLHPAARFGVDFVVAQPLDPKTDTVGPEAITLWNAETLGARDDAAIAAAQNAEPAPPSIAELVAYAATKRFAVETGGVTLNGVRVATDRDSQSMVANAYAGMQASGAQSVKFKAASGWIELSTDQLKALALTVFTHVQACFTAEDAADAGINAQPPTITTFSQIDAAFAGLAPTA